jgi:hypothetical protein
LLKICADLLHICAKRSREWGEWVLLPENFASVYHVGGVLITLLRPAGGLRPSFASLKTQKLRSPLRGVCTVLAQLQNPKKNNGGFSDSAR